MRVVSRFTAKLTKAEICISPTVGGVALIAARCSWQKLRTANPSISLKTWHEPRYSEQTRICADLHLVLSRRAEHGIGKTGADLRKLSIQTRNPPRTTAKQARILLRASASGKHDSCCVKTVCLVLLSSGHKQACNPHVITVTAGILLQLLHKHQITRMCFFPRKTRLLDALERIGCYMSHKPFFQTCCAMLQNIWLPKHSKLPSSCQNSAEQLPTKFYFLYKI